MLRVDRGYCQYDPSRADQCRVAAPHQGHDRRGWVRSQRCHRELGSDCGLAPVAQAVGHRDQRTAREAQDEPPIARLCFTGQRRTAPSPTGGCRR